MKSTSPPKMAASAIGQFRRFALRRHRGKQRRVVRRRSRRTPPSSPVARRRAPPRASKACGSSARAATRRKRSRIDLVFEVSDAPVVRAFEPPRLARAQRPQVEHARHRRDEAGDVGVVQAVRRQQAGQRRARWHAPGDDLAVGSQNEVLAAERYRAGMRSRRLHAATAAEMPSASAKRIGGPCMRSGQRTCRVVRRVNGDGEGSPWYDIRLQVTRSKLQA